MKDYLDILLRSISNLKGPWKRLKKGRISLQGRKVEKTFQSKVRATDGQNSAKMHASQMLGEGNWKNGRPWIAHKCGFHIQLYVKYILYV